VRVSAALRRVFLWLKGVPQFSADVVRRSEDSIGGPNPWLLMHGIMSLSKLRFFGPVLAPLLQEHNPHADLGMDRERAQRWHPLHRGIWIAGRVHLAGLLLQAKGDRVAMHSSVETRYPFLDEDVFDFLARLHPRYALRGLKDKYLLRLLAERWLPRSIAWRRKVMFRAPLDSFHVDPAPPFVEQLLSEESLRRTGYFDVAAVRHWRRAHRQLRANTVPRISIEMGLSGVVATQLWHHTFIDGQLADLPTWAGSALIQVGKPNGSPSDRSVPAAR